MIEDCDTWADGQVASNVSESDAGLEKAHPVRPVDGTGTQAKGPEELEGPPMGKGLGRPASCPAV
jgi:hypothetical protein